MTGPLGNSEFCFPRISMFPSTSSRETLRFSGNKIHCSPRDQSLSVYYFISLGAVRGYKSKHFEDRMQPFRFVEYMVGFACLFHKSVKHFACTKCTCYPDRL